MSETPKKGGVALHTKILFGLILGAASGITANSLVAAGKVEADTIKTINKYVMSPVGDIFLNMLLMTVIPLVFCSLAVGVAQLGDLGKLGRIGAKTFAYFILTMTLATVIGLTLVNTIRPGEYVSKEGRERLEKEYTGELQRKVEAGEEIRRLENEIDEMRAKAEYRKGEEPPKQPTRKPPEEKFGVHTFVNIVPKNPLASAVSFDMLAIIFFALLVGAGLTRIDPEKGKLITKALDGFSDLMVFIIGIAMLIAPFGVFAFLFRVSSTLGADVLRLLGMYVFVVVLGLAIHFFGSFSILILVFSRMNPLVFFRKVRAVIVTAFSTSSSNATLPTSLKVSQEELGVPKQIAGFVLPLGATMNMNGTALFEGVTVVFLAQVIGVPLDFGQQLIVIVLSVLMAVGAAGVPGGSLPLLMIILATVKVPPENIAIILGVDRILDMCRTTLNVVGDITCATFITRSEGLPFEPKPINESPT